MNLNILVSSLFGKFLKFIITASFNNNKDGQIVKRKKKSSSLSYNIIICLLKIYRPNFKDILGWFKALKDFLEFV